MPDYRFMAQQLSEPLSLQRRPVAVAFREISPAGPGNIPSHMWLLAHRRIESAPMAKKH